MAILDTRRGQSRAELRDLRLATLSEEDRAKENAKLTPEEQAYVKYLWEFNARPNQLLPPSDVVWQTWMLMAGRGFGKTRTGAEICRQWIKDGFNYVNIIAPTADDARDICVEGESGILAICPPREKPEYMRATRQLRWPNGAISLIFTADEPERLRGKQHQKLWCDELAAWRYLQEAWDQAMFGLRLGKNPQAVVTTTPRPLKPIKEMIASDTTFLTRGGTRENQRNLATAFFSRIINKYEGTRLGRQELDAELLEDRPGALWSTGMIERHRVKSEEFWKGIFPFLTRVVGAVDPAISSSETSAETGIVFVGIDKRQPAHFYVFDDLSDTMSPDAWARKAVSGYRQHKADKLIAEKNNGGEMVEATIRHCDPNVPLKLVSASRGKITRAEPIAALYEQGRVHHVGMFSFMEEQMCEYDPALDMESPDRMDALVWGLTELSEVDESLGLIEFYKSGQAEAVLAQIRPPETPNPGSGGSSANRMPSDAGQTGGCPGCGGPATTKIAGGQMRCFNCGRQWWPGGAPAVYRGEKRAAPAATGGFFGNSPGKGFFGR